MEQRDLFTRLRPWLARLRYAGAFFALLLCMFLLTLPVFGATVSQGFVSDTGLAVGTLVAVDPNDPKKVQPASIAAYELIVGTVVDGGDSLLELQNEETNVGVATSGEMPVLVSDLNGAGITTGTALKASVIKGVVERTDSENDYGVIGVATEAVSFDGATLTTSNAEIGGEQRSVRVARVTMRLFDKGAREEAPQGVVRSALVSVGSSIVGRQVGGIQVVVSTVLFVISLIIGTVLTYSAIHGSFVSIGRNPLATPNIFRNLRKNTLLAIGVMVIGFVGSYLVLLI